MNIAHRRLDYREAWTLPTVLLFTGNPYIRTDGAIVMGRGAAKQVRDTYPSVQYDLANQMRPNAHLLWSEIADQQYIGWFRVKDHWAQEARVELIGESARQLARVANARPSMTFKMNFPGIGNGKRTIEEVTAVLDILPDNVWLYI